jgi:type II secretory pathway pseudopilin PulG
MMNPNGTPHHKIFGLRQACHSLRKSDRLAKRRPGEAGYTLVALLALMTLLAMFAAAAAPSIVQQAQREREKEAIFRGEQVADAIRVYYKERRVRGDGGLPTSIDQLLEGIPRGTKKVQILRASAARDLLSSSGEWRLVKPRSTELIEFEQSVVLYAGNFLPTPKDTQLSDLQANSAVLLGGLINTGSTSSAPGGEDSSASSSGPFVGVASRSRRNSVLTYYGIDRHDQWIFTPLFR